MQKTTISVFFFPVKMCALSKTFASYFSVSCSSNWNNVPGSAS